MNKPKIILFFDTGGKKPVVVFLHGAATNKEVMWYTAQSFSKNFRCILPDLPFHGKIPGSDISSINDMAKYIEALINHLKIQEYFVVGFSMGGMIVYELLKNDEGCKKAVIWSAPLLGKVGLRKRFLATAHVLPLVPLELYKSSGFFKDFASKAGIKLSAVAQEALFGLEKENIISLLEIIKNYSPSKTLKKGKFFIFSPNDPLVNTKCYEFGKTMCLWGDRCICKTDAGHFGSNSVWQEIFGEIQSFLK